MFYLDLPTEELLGSTIAAQLVDNGTSNSPNVQPYARAGVCKIVFAPSGNTPEQPATSGKGFYYLLSPANDAINALYLKNPKVAELLTRNPTAPFSNELTMDSADFRLIKPDSITIQAVERPMHGALGADNGYYLPKPGFTGKDRFVLQAKAGAYVVQLVYYVNVLGANAYYTARKNLGAEVNLLRQHCPNDTEWLLQDETGVEGKPTNRLTLDPSSLQSLLSATHLDSSITVDTADLPGSAVGTTTGTTITLDTTATGHGWYIDYTPYLNDEYLPTSNPNEWIAKADSEAAGKMDLLSVLLHEYGHVLGIEHSPDSGDFMAATLAPGVRRLPSSEELALMAQLVGEIKLAQGGNGAPNPSLPTDPTLPSLPLSALGLALIGRLRRTDYGTLAPEFSGASLLPQYQIAIRLNRAWPL